MNLNSYIARVFRKLSAPPPYFHPKGWDEQDARNFNKQSKAYIFKSIASHFLTTRMEGDYWEFGCFGALTMRMAWDYFHCLRPNMSFHAFDSFEGFPEINDDDVGHWKKGDLCMSEKGFQAIAQKHGMDSQKLVTCKGFFQDSLPKLAPHYGRERPAPAVIYVDVDISEPTSLILEFIEPFLRRDMVIVFDDWHAFGSDPLKGEQKAFSQFRTQHPHLYFTPFVETHLSKAFIFLGRANELSK